jgi:hypothetical protein
MLPLESILCEEYWRIMREEEDDFREEDAVFECTEEEDNVLHVCWCRRYLL